MTGTRSVRRVRTRTMAVTGVAVLAIASAVGLSITRSEADRTTVYAYFQDASPLIVGNDVKMDGVKVGVIDSIEVEHGQARVGLRVEPAARPLHTDATVEVRPVGLLGERYVDLHRGSPSAPVIPEGGKLTVDHTSSATDLDQVVNTLNEPTSTALAALVTTLGEGLRGVGPNADAAVKALRPAMTDTRGLVTLLNQQSDMLKRLIDSLQPLTSALATDHGRQLDSVVASSDTLLNATAKNEQALDRMLGQLPGTLTDARRTLRALSGTARSTTPNLRSLRPLTDQLAQISREMSAFSKVADPALNGLDPVLVEGRALIDNARPVVQTLRAAGPDLRGALKGARPVVNQLLDNLRDVLDFVKYWALTTNGEDGISHYFRAHLVITTQLATGLLPKAASGPKAGSGLVPKVPRLPVVDGLLNQLGGIPLLNGLGNLLGGTSSTADRSGTAGSATGLTSAQESSLIQSLIGGH